MSAVAEMEKPETVGEQVRNLLDQLVDTSYLCRMFRRGELTIHLWRRDKGLPVVRIHGEGRDTIRYDRAEVLAWANNRGYRIFPVK